MSGRLPGTARRSSLATEEPGRGVPAHLETSRATHLPSIAPAPRSSPRRGSLPGWHPTFIGRGQDRPRKTKGASEVTDATCRTKVVPEDEDARTSAHADHRRRTHHRARGRRPARPVVSQGVGTRQAQLSRPPLEGVPAQITGPSTTKPARAGFGERRPGIQARAVAEGIGELTPPPSRPSCWGEGSGRRARRARPCPASSARAGG